MDDLLVSGFSLSKYITMLADEFLEWGTPFEMIVRATVGILNSALSRGDSESVEKICDEIYGYIIDDLQEYCGVELVTHLTKFPVSQKCSLERLIFAGHVKTVARNKFNLDYTIQSRVNAKQQATFVEISRHIRDIGSGSFAMVYVYEDGSYVYSDLHGNLISDIRTFDLCCLYRAFFLIYSYKPSKRLSTGGIVASSDFELDGVWVDGNLVYHHNKLRRDLICW